MSSGSFCEPLVHESLQQVEVLHRSTFCCDHENSGEARLTAPWLSDGRVTSLPVVSCDEPLWFHGSSSTN